MIRVKPAARGSNITEILAGLDRSTTWLGAARSISKLASASRMTRLQRSAFEQSPNSVVGWIVLPPREPEVLQLRPLTTAQGVEAGRDRQTSKNLPKIYAK